VKKLVVKDHDDHQVRLKRELAERHLGGTPGFNAPELFLLGVDVFEKHYNDFACDVFSVGMSIACWLLRRSWFFEHDPHSSSILDDKTIEAEQIRLKVTRPYIEEHLAKQWRPDEVKWFRELRLLEVLYKSIEHDPSKRITAREAKNILESQKSVRKLI
jgi:serine/threonine protein kinase